MGDPSEDLELRRQIGIALRFPVVAVLAILWVLVFWWWMAPLGVVLGLIYLILTPIAYPALYVFTYVSLAFNNSKEPVLKDYFKAYPDEELGLCLRSLKVGFKTLNEWLVRGFS